MNIIITIALFGWIPAIVLIFGGVWRWLAVFVTSVHGGSNRPKSWAMRSL